MIINVDGDEWIEGIDRSDTLIKDINLSQKEIIDKIHELGIVGLGGATFPSHVKLMVPEGKKAEVLIINGVECDSRVEITEEDDTCNIKKIVNYMSRGKNSCHSLNPFDFNKIGDSGRKHDNRTGKNWRNNPRHVDL